jgi:hypothetical protein
MKRRRPRISLSGYDAHIVWRLLRLLLAGDVKAYAEAQEHRKALEGFFRRFGNMELRDAVARMDKLDKWRDRQ